MQKLFEILKHFDAMLIAFYKLSLLYEIFQLWLYAFFSFSVDLSFGSY